jgi:hypothetical protein
MRPGPSDTPTQEIGRNWDYISQFPAAFNGPNRYIQGMVWSTAFLATGEHSDLMATKCNKIGMTQQIYPLLDSSKSD